MNIKQALQTVHLDDVMRRLGKEPDPKKSRGRDLWFASPFRQEKDPSFHLDSIKNIWYDFGEGMGGNTIAFARKYLESHGQASTTSDALTLLSQYKAQTYTDNKLQTTTDTGKALSLTKLQPLKNAALIQYLSSRMIDIEIAKEHVREAYTHNSITRKDYFGLAFANEKGGYEFRNKYIKSTIGKKAISFIKGKYDTKTVHLFEGFIDFLTLATLKKRAYPIDDAIILNSLSFLQQTTDYLINNGYETVFIWFDNDSAGDKAKTIMKEWAENHPNIVIRDMAEIYAPFIDVNEWHIESLKM
ncbi:MAG: toprim domain-containing protein [Roseivirga sp.]